MMYFYETLWTMYHFSPVYINAEQVKKSGLLVYTTDCDECAFQETLTQPTSPHQVPNRTCISALSLSTLEPFTLALRSPPTIEDLLKVEEAHAIKQRLIEVYLNVCTALSTLG